MCGSCHLHSGHPNVTRAETGTNQLTLLEKPLAPCTILFAGCSGLNARTGPKDLPSPDGPVSETAPDAVANSPSDEPISGQSPRRSCGIPYGKAKAKVSPGVFTSPDATNMYCLPLAI